MESETNYQKRKWFERLITAGLILCLCCSSRNYVTCKDENSTEKVNITDPLEAEEALHINDLRILPQLKNSFGSSPGMIGVTNWFDDNRIFRSPFSTPAMYPQHIPRRENDLNIEEQDNELYGVGHMHGMYGKPIMRNGVELMFGYEADNGPRTWCPRFRGCCGKFQSPIDIQLCQAKPVGGRPLRFRHYDCTPNALTLTNNGRTVMLKAGYLGMRPWIEGGGLTEKYTLDSVHFHWGSGNHLGSEHTIDSNAFPIEMHLVHFLQSATNLEKALEFEFGGAVVSILFHVSLRDNENFNPIIENLRRVQFKDETFVLPNMFELFTLLPESTNCFFRYLGSLTTPNCTQTIIWSVMGDTVPISTRQLQEFRKLFATERNSEVRPTPLVNNFRPVQPLNERVVHKFGCKKMPGYCPPGSYGAMDEFPSMDDSIFPNNGEIPFR